MSSQMDDFRAGSNVEQFDAAGTGGRKPGLRLLSLDGGGVRGVSEICIIRDLMEKVKVEQNLDQNAALPKPCDIFDLICGTSTGGLLANMLGRLRMSIEECERSYAQFANFVFGDPRSKLDMREGRFKDEKLKQAIVDTVAACQQDDTLLDPRNDQCKIFVCAAPTSNTNRARRLTSYNPNDNCAIWEAARATTAAPTFFKPAEICFANGITETFVDGAMGCNNPTLELVDEAQRIFKNREIDCIISVGSGTAPPLELKKPTWLEKKIYTHIVPTLAKIATDCQKTHDLMFTQFKDRPQTYFRFSAVGVGAIGLEEWKRLGDIRGKTLAYMNEPENREKAEQAARNLSFSLAQSRFSQANIIGLKAIDRDSELKKSFPDTFSQPEPRLLGAHHALPTKHTHTTAGSIFSPFVDGLLKNRDQILEVSSEAIERQKEAFIKSLGIDLEVLTSVKAKKANPLPGTCEWFTSDRDVFQTWKGHSSDQVLVVTAPPGSGKSVLAKHIFNKLRNESREATDSLLLEHFCERSENHGNIRSILSALIFQILAHQQNLFTCIIRETRASEVTQEHSLATLWKILATLVRNLEICNIYCLIDGVDECESESEASLLQGIETYFVNDFFGQRPSCCQIRFLLTSRPTALATRLGGLTTLYEIQLSDTQQDISSYVDYQLHRAVEAKLLPSNLSNEVRTRLNSHADGMFLWVSLNLERLIQIKPGRSRSQVLKLLEDTPSNIQSIYTLALEQIMADKNNWESAQMIFGVLLFSYEPLSVEACAIACHDWTEGINSHGELEEELDSQFELSIKGACSPFTYIVNDQVQFCHSTAAQFLTESMQPHTTGKFDSKVFHLRLAKVCLQYLMLEDLGIPSKDDPETFFKFPFLSYALRNWHKHLEASGEFFRYYPSLLQRFFDTRASPIETCLRGWVFEDDEFSSEQWPSDTPAFHALVKLGLKSVLQHVHLFWPEEPEPSPGRDSHILTLRTYVDVPARDRWTPLMRAVDIPSFEAFQFLQSLGADTTAIDADGESILHLITRQTGEEIFKISETIPLSTKWDVKNSKKIEPLHLLEDPTVATMILQRATDMNYRYSSLDDGSAVYHAVNRENAAVLETLIHFGAHIVVDNSEAGHNPYYHAAASGQVEIFKMLLEASPPVCSWKHAQPEMLHRACLSGSLEMANVVLELGWDVDVLSITGVTALTLASYVGSHTLVDMLLREGADPTGPEEQTFGPLHSAAYEGHLKTVQTLLKAGASVDALGCGPSNLTPSWWAAVQGHAAVVLELLDAGAQVDIRESDGETLLHAATSEGRDDVVKILIEAGVEVNSRSSTGCTALLTACLNYKQERSESFVEVVKLLLQAGANVNQANYQHQKSPITAAVTEGSIEITQLLLHHGADALQTDTDGWNALHHAVFNDRSDILILLITGIAPGIDESRERTNMGQCPYRDTRSNVVQRFVWSSEEIESEHGFGISPLYSAIQCGHEDCMSTLLTYQADPNQADRSGTTPLHRAIYSGNVSVVKTLLAYGGDPTRLDAFGKSCIDWAENSPSLRETIIQWLESYEPPSEHKRLQKLTSSIVHLCRYLKLRKSEVNLTYRLCRYLIFTNELEEALVAAQSQAEDDEDEVQHPRICDGCRKDPIVGKCYVCKSCPDVDLCQVCMQAYEESFVFLEGCKGHEFLEVPETIPEALRDGFVNELNETWDDWLSRIQTKFENRLNSETSVREGTLKGFSGMEVDLSTVFANNFTI